ncbi:MAG: hypothetical protein KKA05_03690, partial [Alphaproteobacteria bacterium]|nr:hypothetical protein [Alphaproteobacteria bacterium]
PCPADPAETPGDTDFGTERAACTTTPNATGILPFRSLHLDDDAARDAWGRYFTYAISPVFANATDNNVFYRCRSERWVNDLGTIPADRNENAAKARFCCPPALLRTEDLVILDAANNAREAAPTFSERTADGAPAYGDINTVDLIGAPNTNATAFAVALVSHGSNGNGAFAGNGTTDRLDSTGVSAAEDENANGDNIYVDRPMVMEEGNNYYDDIVMTRTQTSLYSELNNASCFRPWR